MFRSVLIHTCRFHGPSYPGSDMTCRTIGFDFVLHVELAPLIAVRCTSRSKFVIASERFLALHSHQAEFTELSCFPTSVGQPLFIHFYSSTLLLVPYSVRTLQIIHVCASTTVLTSCHNAEYVMCRFMSSITWTVL